jgi:hypothetical protein
VLCEPRINGATAEGCELSHLRWDSDKGSFRRQRIDTSYSYAALLPQKILDVIGFVAIRFTVERVEP